MSDHIRTGDATPSTSYSGAAAAGSSSSRFRTLSNYGGSSSIAQISADELSTLRGSLRIDNSYKTRTPPPPHLPPIPMTPPLNISEIVPQANGSTTADDDIFAGLVDQFQSVVTQVQQDTEDGLRLESPTSFSSSSADAHDSLPGLPPSYPGYTFDGRIATPPQIHIRVLGGYVHRMPTVESVSSHDAQSPATSSSHRDANAAAAAAAGARGDNLAELVEDRMEAGGGGGARPHPPTAVDADARSLASIHTARSSPSIPSVETGHEEI